MKSYIKKINIWAENAASRLSEPMNTKLCSQSFPIMLLISAVDEEQLRATAQSDTAASPSRELSKTSAWHQSKADVTRTLF